MAYLLVRIIICFWVEAVRFSIQYFLLWMETLNEIPKAFQKHRKRPKLTISAEYRGKYILCTSSDGRTEKVPFTDGLTLKMALEIVAIQWVSGEYFIVSGPTSAVLVQE